MMPPQNQPSSWPMFPICGAVLLSSYKHGDNIFGPFFFKRQLYTSPRKALTLLFSLMFIRVHIEAL